MIIQNWLWQTMVDQFPFFSILLVTERKWSSEKTFQFYSLTGFLVFSSCRGSVRSEGCLPTRADQRGFVRIFIKIYSIPEMFWGSQLKMSDCIIIFSMLEKWHKSCRSRTWLLQHNPRWWWWCHHYCWWRGQLYWCCVDDVDWDRNVHKVIMLTNRNPCWNC